MSDNPLLTKAAQLVAQARDVRDRYPDHDVPAEATQQIDRLLNQAAALRKQAEQDAELASWSAPDYRHANFDAAPHGKGIDGGHGDPRATFDRDRARFLDFVRKGNPAGVLDMEQKASLVEDSTGQNLVPSDYAGTIVKDLSRLGQIRALATVRPTTRNKVDVGAVAVGSAGWGKLETGTSTTEGLAATPASKQTITVHDLTALCLIGVDELDDADDNLEGIIRAMVAEKFAEAEDDAFAAGAGDASNQPYAITNTVTQKVTAAVNATPTPDDLKALQWKVPARHRLNGAYVMHSDVEKAVALMKDNTGAYLLQPSANLGEPSTLFGKRVVVADGLASPTTTGTATDKSVVFGDFKSGYLVCDRVGLRVQRLVERYADVGKVGLLFTKRVGADVIRAKALAFYEL